ncbi:hypothetical protein A2961_04415 [Candidatus Woesebacteria bacterium RIFCSPLOWO2_01_FULL_39_21]|uniref:Uncharacterized protein n=1 Tax=Candidatus Woesebacteria bacterium RIFCSPLOWO2_01_FULL_39_21 TaxID=1802519 RepID=A0A1F8BKB4_9BACT|nr:MAG: hypothetical protein A2691_01885 [Candidatus Woesebacteria bacterium RIFCSPHIGHO2_01_FULL_39_23]OGM64473.1 MAG: hypothetical protein A2961_04415 [Candidatus Woesebacteria bacterium RIFCSPLOWO2_01_FULL_39_21]
MVRWKKVKRYKYQQHLLDYKGKTKSTKLLTIAKFIFLSVVVGLVGFFVIITVFSFTLPPPDQIVRRIGFSTKILDRNGKILYDIFTDQKRTKVNLDQVSDWAKKATISIEDKNFYQHQGFDPTGYARAIFNIIFRGKLQGGSTLTQQLVKNVLLSPERTILRKIKEFVLTVQVEQRYSKDEILELYLNEMPYGGTAFGIEAAAETYFGKSARDLNLAEAAILAGLPQRPSYYSPYTGESGAYVSRAESVLRRLKEDGHIRVDQEEEAKKSLSEVKINPRSASFKAPHFVQYVQRELEDRFGESVVESGGLKVTTTLDLSLQEAAQQVVAEEIEKVESLNITNGAAIVSDPQTGEILAMVGSKDFSASDYDGQVNVTLSLRQPGSAIKPVTYVTGLKKGYTASTLIMDVPTTFPGGVNQPDYNPVNYDGKYRGPVQVRYALANSINMPAVKMLAMVGIKNVLETAYDLGISTLEPTNDTLSRVGLSLTLGGGEVKLLELTNAYNAFVNEGRRTDPVTILKVEDGTGKILEENDPKTGRQVMSPEEAYIIADILSDNDARSAIFGTNSLLNIAGRKIAVKTGTTNDKRDNWTLGGNPSVMVGVWVGNNDNSHMKQVASGVSGASPIWRRILLNALEAKQNKTTDAPSSIVTVSVDILSGYRAHDGFPSRTEIFIKGTEPVDDQVHVKLKVCKADGKLATPSDIARGDFEEKEFYIFKEEDPTAAPGQPNRWQEGILNWLNTQPDPKYHPPSDYCGIENPVNVDFMSPHDLDSNLPGTFKMKVTADSSYKITLVEFEVDGFKVRSFDGLPFEYDLTLEKGTHELRALARDEKGNVSDRKIKVGVGVPWDATATPSPTSNLSPSPTPTT